MIWVCLKMDDILHLWSLKIENILIHHAILGSPIFGQTHSAIFQHIVTSSSGLFHYFSVEVPREAETVKKAATAEKDGFLSKKTFFFEFPNFPSALSHEVLPLMRKIQQCC